MSEEQISALLVRLKQDSVLLERLRGASDLETAIAIVREAGFDVSKSDWQRYQSGHVLELSDDELEGVAGGCQGWTKVEEPARPEGKEERPLI